jgi:peptidoglycan/xylan/chitin deacetylase (PgdA/CDA1 family)
VTRLPTDNKVVALTFDGCEQRAPKKLDTAISDYLVHRHIPFTIFAAGAFARDNADSLRALTHTGLVEVENHSWNHPQHLQLLSDTRVRQELNMADAEIRNVTGRRTEFFRFPAGNYDRRTLALVERLGYRVVHWRWEAGDPDRFVSATQIVDDALEKTRPGDIIILHINGRGVHTAAALPRLVDGLEKKGYRFVRLDAYLKPARSREQPL